MQPEDKARERSVRRTAAKRQAPARLLTTPSPGHTYQLYGLRLRSRWPLALPRSDGEKTGAEEIQFLQARVHLTPAVTLETTPNGTNWCRLQDDSVYVQWPGLFEFRISTDGSSIIGRAYDRAYGEAFQAHLLGPVLSFALLQRGIEPLHSTAVVIDGAAVGFAGEQGYGKSTLAAAFLQAGYRLLTDDLLVLRKKREGWLAYPGPPRIKLFPRIAHGVFDPRFSETRLNARTSKLLIPLGDIRHQPSRVPLKAIYMLTPGKANSSGPDRVQIRRIPRRLAFLRLLQSSYNTVFFEAERLKHQFHLAAEVAAAVPMKSLTYPRKLEWLPLVREAILSDLRQ